MTLLSQVAAALLGGVTTAWLIVVCCRDWIRDTAQRARAVEAQGREVRRQWRELDELLNTLPDPHAPSNLPPSWARNYTTELAILLGARLAGRRS